MRARGIFAGLLACLIGSAATAGNWQPWGPGDANVGVSTHPAVAGQAMLGGNVSGLMTWVTTDGGGHWTSHPWRGTYGQPWLAGTPTVAWIDTGVQLLRSTDVGRSWGPVASPRAIYEARIVGVDPLDANSVVLAGGDRIHRTSDGGSTWSVETPPGRVWNGVVDWSSRRLIVEFDVSSDAHAGRVGTRPLDAAGPWVIAGEDARLIGAGHGVVLYQDGAGTLHRSLDGGATYTPVVHGLGVVEFGDFAFASAPSKRVYAVGRRDDGDRLLRSDDDGATWTFGAAILHVSYGDPLLAVDGANADRLYLSTLDGVLASVDGGASFVPLARSAGAPSAARMLARDAVDPSRYWIHHRLFELNASTRRTIDGGATWTPVADPWNLLGTSRQRTNTVFGWRAFGEIEALGVSTDGGVTWSTKLEEEPDFFYEFGPLGFGTSPGTLFLPARGFAGGAVDFDTLFVSTDDGESLVRRTLPPITVFAFASPTGGSPLTYGGGRPLTNEGAQLWRTTDNGGAWQAVATFSDPWPGIVQNAVTAIAVDPSDAQTIYAGLELPDHLMRSVDGGVTWTRATAGLGAGAVTSIVVDPAHPSIVYAAAYSSGVFRSVDRGLNWTALDDGLRDDSVRQLVLDPLSPGILYASTDSGLFRVDLSSGLPAGRRRAIEFYHAQFDHYFVSADVDEIAGLDAGVFEGWARTGEGFRVAEGVSPGNAAVCRFFGVGFAPKSSHFYTPYPAECDIVKADPNWTYEKIAFGLALPHPVTRGCPPDTRPLYRAWNRNQGGAPNHRYNTGLDSLANSVLRQGWVHEGEASTLVFACVPV